MIRGVHPYAGIRYAVGLPQPGEPVASDVQERTVRLPKFHVVLLDDDEHTYEYVIEMLVNLFGHNPKKAYELALTVDATGRVVVDTTTRERAQLKRDQILTYGPDPRLEYSANSMAAVLESAA